MTPEEEMAFNQIAKEYPMAERPNEYAQNNDYDPYGPYGVPQAPQKTGLTPRGKAAIALGIAIIGGGSIIGWNVHSSNEAEREQKAQEIALQQERLELERLKEMNRADEKESKATNAADKIRQANVDACVKANASKVDKATLGAPSHGDVVEDCQAQYPASADGSDMAAAGSASDGDGEGGGLNDSMLAGAVVVVAAVALFAKKNTKSNG
ncbi:hypothetical protein [Streptomyces flavofungini]|uniref:hypothetical protein n=1 Tax=Streptomyces flavofungini TaxID=68200 RepID=UPI0034DFFFA3